MPSSEPEARYFPFLGSQASVHTVESCPDRVVEQNQSSEGSSRYNLIVSSYEAEARIYTSRVLEMKSKVSERRDIQTSSFGCHATHLTSCVCSISTPMHSKSESGWTRTAVSIF